MSTRSAVTLVVIAGLLWSLGGVLVRLVADASGWQIIFYRSIFQILAIHFFIVIAHRKNTSTRYAAIGARGLIAATALTGAFVAFVFSVLSTTVANTVFIQTGVPFLSAFLGFVFLKENTSPRVWAGMLVACLGVLLMVGDGLSADGGKGTLIAVGGAICLAIYVVALRSGQMIDMLPANVLAGVFSVLIAGAALGSFSISIRDLILCAILGTFQTGLGLVAFTLGSRHVPAAELALLSLVHVVVSPIWVWLAVAEVPSWTTFAGGGLLLSAILGTTLLQIRESGISKGSGS